MVRIDMAYMRVAMRVLEAVKRELAGMSGKDLGQVYLKAYQNGREQGYTLVRAMVDAADVRPYRSVSFSEARSLYKIVVYSDIDYPKDQGLSEEAYKSCKYFDMGEYGDAADFIVDFLFSKGQ